MTRIHTFECPVCGAENEATMDDHTDWSGIPYECSECYQAFPASLIDKVGTKLMEMMFSE